MTNPLANRPKRRGRTVALLLTAAALVLAIFTWKLVAKIAAHLGETIGVALVELALGVDDNLGVARCAGALRSLSPARRLHSACTPVPYTWHRS